MGIFSSGADSARKVRKLLAAQYGQNQQLVGDAQQFAEQQIQPYMLDPSVMQELQGAVTGGPMSYQQSPLFQRYMDVGRETMMQDMAGTGTLYSGKRMEGMRDLGQSAFANYMQTLSGLASFGRDTASQLGGIRMQGANALAGMGNQYASDVSNVRMAQSANQSQLGLGALEGGAGAAAGAFAAMSDPALKQNIVAISRAGPLTVYRWEWTEEARQSDLPLGDTVGFMADEVQKIYPQHVERIGGFLAVKYGPLMKDLEAA